MNLNDLNEAPMGILNRLGQKVLSKVPFGGVGAKAQGKLDAGTLANKWKKEYMQFLGQIGQKASTENLSSFLRSKKSLSTDELNAFMRESSLYERALTNKEVDGLMMRAVQQAFAGRSGAPKQAKPAGRIEPTIGAPGAATPASSSPAPAAPAAPAATAPAPAKPAADPKALKTDAAGGYIRKWATDLMNTKDQKQKVALAKEMINFLSDRKGTPEGSRLASAVAAMAAKSKDPVLSKMIKPVRALRMERANYVIASQILAEIGLTWKDLDMRISLSESTTDYVVIVCR